MACQRYSNHEFLLVTPWCKTGRCLNEPCSRQSPVGLNTQSDFRWRWYKAVTHLVFGVAKIVHLVYTCKFPEFFLSESFPRHLLASIYIHRFFWVFPNLE